MSMTMVMEEDEDAEIEHVFVAHEIDLDYEFDAARFFDFTRPETPAEALQAELWFQTAASYPPLPFVRRLVVREDLFLDDVSDSPKSEGLDCTSNVDDEKSSVPLQTGILDTAFEDNGLTFGSKTITNNLNSKAKSTVSKSSTLMKPTTSQLAKQNLPAKNVGSRFQKLLLQNEQNLSISSGVESQASKRQKLEGGLLCKVPDVKPQTNFFHKTRMRDVMVEQNSGCSKLRLTIPREPDLRTAQRAHRMRPKNVAEAERVTVAAPRFKARPLNRKILEAPSLPPPKRSTPRLPEFQEFHLKTSERAIQHTSATSSSLHCYDSDKGWDKHTTVSLENRIKDLRRPTAGGAPTYDGLGFTHIFKARPLNKKITRSKGDGVFRKCRQETTVPMEFDLQSEKEVQQDPPIELFSKLSLTSECQPNNGSHFKLPQHSGMCRKEKTFMFGANQTSRGNGGCINLMGERSSYIKEHVLKVLTNSNHSRSHVSITIEAEKFSGAASPTTLNINIRPQICLGSD
ncbi:protein TPX2 isoform X2 [Vigna angularis]|uniref:protein TPX2 isoform X2 n=1 Tax=Phaseolus angularis TaxID=3914 RepID=UPI0022B3AC4C|nr:protein TPX2 isoform X2 [Vigna angularis]